jgi:hypothetical protein
MLAGHDGHLAGRMNGEVNVKRCGETPERVECRCAIAILPPGDDGLRCTDSVSELFLRKSAFDPCFDQCKLE